MVAGGLSAAGTSTTTVFAVGHSASVRVLTQLQSAIHDAAAATVGDRVLVFGGGQTEGSDQVVQAFPGSPRQVARLPQSLSDLAAASLDGSTYIIGGWNGTTPNTAVYRSRGSGAPVQVGRLQVGVRYPAVAAVGGKIVVAGGEDSAGSPTSKVVIFDPRSGRSHQAAILPAPMDHAAGVTLGGRFYVVGGLRDGRPSDAVLSWAPGGARFVRAGRLPTPLADAAAVPFAGGIAVIGGRAPSGPVDSVLLLRPR